MVLLHLENTTFHKGRENSTAKTVSVLEQPQEKEETLTTTPSLRDGYESLPKTSLGRKQTQNKTELDFSGLLCLSILKTSAVFQANEERPVKVFR